MPIDHGALKKLFRDEELAEDDKTARDAIIEMVMTVEASESARIRMPAAVETLQRLLPKK